jgi:predicted nucleic acid-binding protein
VEDFQRIGSSTATTPMPGRFFDSNILLYAASRDLERTQLIEALILGGGWISTQVLNEVAHVARRKMGFSFAEIRAFLEPPMRLLDVQELSLDVHRNGINLAERYKLSIYDGMIVAAALACDCDMLLTEDMHHGLLIERQLRVINPFVLMQ